MRNPLLKCLLTLALLAASGNALAQKVVQVVSG